MDGWIKGAGLSFLLALGELGEPRAIGGVQQDAAEPDDGVAGERGRAELAALVKGAFERAKDVRDSRLEEDERALGIPLFAAEGEGLRVLASSNLEEARHVARAMGAALHVFRELFQARAGFPPGCTVFVLADQPAKEAFLGRHPAITSEARAWMSALECSGIEGTADWGWWEGDAEKRLDGTVRMAFDWLFKSACGVTVESQPGLHEGFGFYLTHALVGTRLMWFVPPRAGDPRKNAKLAALQNRLSDPESDWMMEARGLFDAKQKFDLEELFHLVAGELDAEDYLRCHALAAYLVEVHAGSLPEMCSRLGAEEDPREALEGILGFDLRALRTRLDRWLDGRETLVARAGGRRTDAELRAAWKKLGAAKKRAAIEGFERRVAALDTQQLRLIRALVNAASEPAEAAEPPVYDPTVHAPAQPIARKRLSRTDGRVKRLLARVKPEPDERALRQAFTFDWGSGQAARCGDPRDVETVFANALRGFPPGLDRARASAIQALDREDERKLHAAFGHAYTDRDGNVYPGLTLHDMWASGETIEMPDVDALGIVHEVLDEWKRWVAPVPASAHDALYQVIGGLFDRAHRSRGLREALADCFLIGHPAPRKNYEALEANLHVLWASSDSDPAKLAPTLPDGRQWESFLQGLAERCKQDFQLYSKGKRRAASLRKDGDLVRAALAEALDEAATVEEASSSGR